MSGERKTHPIPPDRWPCECGGNWRSVGWVYLAGGWDDPLGDVPLWQCDRCAAKWDAGACEPPPWEGGP